MEHADLPDLTVNSPLWRAVAGIGRGSGKMSTVRKCDNRKPCCWRASTSPPRAISGSHVEPGPRGSAPVPRRSKECRDDDRSLEFLHNRREDGPCLVLALDVIRDDWAAFAN